MRALIILGFFLNISISSFAAEIKFDIQNSTKGLIVNWNAVSDYKYTILRGTTPDNLEIIAENLIPSGQCTTGNICDRGNFLDQTAEPNIQYFYKIVGETEVKSAFLDKPKNVILYRNFQTDEFEIRGVPAITYVQGEKLENVSLLANPYFEGYTFISHHKNLAKYTIGPKRLVAGKRYILRIEFGEVKGSNILSLSLSPRKPVENFVVSEVEMKQYANKIANFSLLAGPAQWEQISIISSSAKNQHGHFVIKRIMLLDSE